MTAAVFLKMLAVFITVAIGYVAGRMRWLGPATGGEGDPSRVLSNAAFYVFVPALLFRTTARLDFASVPWRLVGAFFIPVVGVMLAVYAWQRWRKAGASTLSADGQGVAAPAVRAVGVGFGNTVQLGIPLSAALYGEAGLGIHIALVSLHALVLLSVVTALAEVDLAHAHAREHGVSALGPALRQIVRNTIIHPVVLPVVAGLFWNALGLPLPSVMDEVLQLLGSAVVPLCLVLIGVSLAYYGLPASMRGAITMGAMKLLLLPAAVLLVARWGFGLTGTPLAVIVTMAALPVGSNALIFAQRYRTLEVEATAAIVLSTTAFMLTLPIWIAVLAYVGD